MKLGRYFLFGKYFREIIDLSEEKIIVKRKYEYKWNDIAYVKREDNTLANMSGPTGLVIFFKDGRGVRISSSIQEYKNRQIIHLLNTKAYEIARDMILRRVRNIDYFGLKDFAILYAVGTPIQLPTIILLLFVFKVDMFSLLFDTIVGLATLLALLIYLYLNKRKRKKVIEEIIKTGMFPNSD